MTIKPIASGSTGNAYLVSDDHSTVLLDAGISLRQIQVSTGFRLSSLAGVLITHRHGDHSKAVKGLIDKGVDVYALDDVFRCAGTCGHHRAHSVIPRESLCIGSFTALPFLVEHDVPCVGWLLRSKITGEKLLYLTDTQYSPFRFDGLTHILLEANYDEQTTRDNVATGVISQSYKNRVWRTHMSIETAIALLQANDLSRVEQIYLIHLSDKNSLEDVFRDRVQRLTGAEVIIC